MSLYYILDSAGEPIATDVETWACWFETANRRVAETRIKGVRISTVFLGLDHQFRLSGRPILWESLIFGGPLDGEMVRYETLTDAIRGHERLVKLVRETV